MSKKTKLILIYIFTFLFLAITIYIVQSFAQFRHSIDLLNITTTQSSSIEMFLDNLREEMGKSISTLLLQISVILLFVKLFGEICRKLNQPSVVGEILAGILLGPSFLGLLFPNISLFIFPSISLKFIEVFSEIGLVLFMFIVGLELKLSDIKRKAPQAIIISHGAIMFTSALAFILSYFLYEIYSEPSVPFLSFGLFMAIAMSITAFPVLARIVHERGINKKNIGNIILTCAAIDDITAWSLLAAIITIVKSNTLGGTIYMIGLTLIYLIFMFQVVKPLLLKMAKNKTSKALMSKSKLMIYFVIMFLSAYATELIGIHALFGAFVAGVVMPSNFHFREQLTHKIEDVTLFILLPLFFVATGLKTEIGLINDISSWLICLLIIAVGVFGKIAGSVTLSRVIGLNWKNSFIIGALMNTRGLMELVVLNIGLDLGILSPKIFSMMVIMAVFTTFMTSPFLNIIDKIFKKDNDRDISDSTLKIMVDDSNNIISNKLQFIANLLINKRENSDNILLFSDTLNYDENYTHNTNNTKIKKTVSECLHNQSYLSFDIRKKEKIITNFAKQTHSNFILMDIDNFILFPNNKQNNEDFKTHIKWRKIFETLTLKNLNAKSSNNIQRYIKQLELRITRFSHNELNVGLFIDNNFILDIRKIFIPILHDDDAFMGQYISRISENVNAQLMLWDYADLTNQSIEFIEYKRKIKKNNPYHYQQWKKNIPLDSNIIRQYDIILISLASWKIFLTEYTSLIGNLPSVLIIDES